MRPTDFQVGQVVYFYNNRTMNLDPHVIVRIGRKWVTAGPEGYSERLHERFDPATMWADGGKYYLSKEAYQQSIERSVAWKEFRQIVQLHVTCPPDISADFIRAIMAVLKETV